MSESDNHLDLSAQMLTPRYAPRPQPLPIPTARWDEEPLLCLKVNDQWVSHILGVLVAMDQGDTWIGTREEIIDARQQVNEIMLAFMEDCDPMSNCCPEPNRTRTVDGKYEISYDGGVTWEDGSDFDPRYTAPQLPSIAGDDSEANKCNAANNVLLQFQDGIETWEGFFDTLGTAIEFAAAVAAAIAAFIFAPASVPIIVTIIIALFSAIWNGGKEAYVAAFTSTVWDDLLCILYCHAENDGTYTEADVDAILADIASHFADNVTAKNAFTGLMRGVRAPGLNQMAKTGSGGSGDCATCDCGVCGSNWSAGFYFGGVLLHADTLDEQGEGYIIVNSYDRGDGVQFAAATAPNASSGCWFTWTLLDHTPSIPAPASCDCGVTPAYESQVINFLMPNPTSGTMFSVLSTSTDGNVPFRLRLDFDTTDCNP